MIFKKKSFNNLIILPMLMLTNFMTLHISDTMMIWFFLEISTLLFIVFVILNNKKLKYEMINYFLIQSISSMMLISLTFFINNQIMNSTMFYNLFIFLMIMILMIKMGLTPFHKWYIFIMNKLDWSSMLLLMTLQKLIPMIILDKVLSLNYMHLMFFFLFMLISNILNEMSMKNVISYSSIFHTMMMIFMIKISLYFFLTYMILYTLMMAPLSLIFKFNKINSLTDLFNQYFNNDTKIIMMSLIMNLCMLPPMYSFSMKWIYFFFLTQMDLLSIILIIMMFSLLFIFIYIRLFMLIFYNNNIYKMKITKLNKNIKTFWIFILIMLTFSSWALILNKNLIMSILL